MRTKVVLVVIVAVIAGLLAGCQGAQPAAAPTAAPSGGESAAGQAALVVKGKVANELSLSKDALVALGTVKFQAEHPKKGMQDYEGVLIKTLLDKAGAQSDAKELVATAGDGFKGTVALADVAKTENCAVILQDDGKLGTVFPGMPSNTWVKDVVSIEIK